MWPLLSHNPGGVSNGLKSGMPSLAVFSFLAAIRNFGVWGYLLRKPASLDGASIGLWLAFGLWPLALAAAAWAVMLGLGRRALGALGLEAAGGLDRVAAAALGLGLLGQAAFFLGWGGGFNEPTMLALVAAATAAAMTGLGRPSGAWGTVRLNGYGALGAGVAAYWAFHLIVVSLAPPVSWDVRAYHLALPELYLRNGRLVEVPWLMHSHWPHLMEVLYAFPLAAGRDGAAALLHAGACAALAAGAFLAGGWPALLLLLGQPAFLRVGPAAHADGACALLLFAAAAGLTRWEETKADGWLAAAGYLAGSSAAAKLFGGAGAAVWTLYLAWRTRRAREAALFAGCAAIAVGPWLLRTYLSTGDPLWPLLRLSPAAAELSARFARSNFWTWPPPPWILTHDGPLFLLAPLAGLALLSFKSAKRPSRLEAFLWLPAPLLLLLAFRNHEGWRLMMPYYAAAALACSRFATAAFAAGGARRAAAAALIALGGAPIFALTQNNEAFAVLGLRSFARPQAAPRDLFEDRTVDVASFYREAAAALPAGSKVLLFREIRGYKAGFEYSWGDPLNQSLIQYRNLPDPEALYRRLKELGVTHVLDHESSHLYGPNPMYYDARTLSMMAQMLKLRARPKLVREGILLFQLL